MLYLNGISLSPMVATIIFMIAVISGYNYRRLWKAEAARWKLWASGLTSAACILILGFIPLNFPQ